ncbi:MAG: KOW domain-containing RNA-binding protein [Oscillospiraceae bacterium]
MSFQRGQLVFSTAGRDKGFYVVVDQSEGYVLIANGHAHRINSPKRKNPKHLAPCARIFGEDILAFDKQLKRVLAALPSGTQ